MKKRIIFFIILGIFAFFLYYFLFNRSILNILCQFQNPNVAFINNPLDFSLLHDLYIAVVCPYPIFSRIPQLMTAWGNSFLSLKGGLRFQIVSSNPNPSKKYVPLEHHIYCPIPNPKIQQYRFAYYLNYLTAKEFYYKTSLNWYLRTTYDCYVHLPNLNKFIHSLNEKYDATKDLVMKGDHEYNFIHGGSGWIMSRALVKLYLDFENTSNKIFDASTIVADDVHIMDFAKHANLNFSDINTPQFSGWPIKDLSYQMLMQSSFNYSVINNPCPTSRRLSRVQDLVIVHNGRKFDYVNNYGQKLIEEAPNWLWISYVIHEGGSFCYFNST